MHKVKILIAENEKHTRDTLFFILENDGYQVVDAVNGKEALQKILKLKESGHSIDLMLLDIEKFSLTGFQLLDELQRHQASIPTIVITGSVDEQTLDRIRKKGCAEYLKKPFDPEEVTACVSRVFKKTKSVEETAAN